MKTTQSKLLILTSTFILCGSAAWAARPKAEEPKTISIRLAVDLEVKQSSLLKVPAEVEATLKVRNLGNEPVVLQSPANQMAATFVVLDSRGNVVSPTGKAKVNRPKRDVTIQPNEEYQHVFEGLNFLTGTGLFGYDLRPGETYRITAIYRPLGADNNGLCSNEIVLNLK